MTALAVADVDGTDSLDDVLVAVRGRTSSQVVVFASRSGAMKGAPEKIDVRGQVTSFATGHVDDRYPIDVVAVAGGKLVLIHGREGSIARVPRARRVEQIPLSLSVSSACAGNFTGDARPELALLAKNGTVYLWQPGGEATPWGALPKAGAVAASRQFLVRASASIMPHDDLLVVDPDGHVIRALAGDADPKRNPHDAPRIGPDSVPASLGVEGAPSAVLAVRTNGDARTDLVVFSSAAPTPATVETVSTLSFEPTDDDWDSFEPPLM